MMGPGQPPTTKEEYLRNPIPNPQMQQALQDVEKYQVSQFAIMQPEFIEDEDLNMIKKDGLYLVKSFTLNTILGIIINVQIKKIPKINFLNWHFILRHPSRLMLMTLPYLINYKQLNEKVLNMDKLNEKYWQRIKIFKRTGDMRSLDPNGMLFEKFQKKQF